MTLLSWREDYEVGVSLIDTEHHYLFDLINEFHDKHASGNTRNEILRVLNRLVAYAEEHFQHEEALMEKIGYPRLDHQHEQHDKLFSSIFELNERLSASPAEVDSKTMRFLKNWLLDHILKDDMDIGDFLRRKLILAERAAEEEARTKAEDKVSAGAPKKAEVGEAEPAVEK